MATRDPATDHSSDSYFSNEGGEPPNPPSTHPLYTGLPTWVPAVLFAREEVLRLILFRAEASVPLFG